MNKQNDADAGATRPVWKKPSIEVVGTVNDVRAGAVRRTTEDPFYNPS